jgi:hypothetical protein
MSGFEADYAVLAGITSTLHAVSEDVDALSSSIPTIGDAGPGTPALVSILAHLVENASSLVIGAGGAGDDVASARLAYEDQDAASSQDLQSAGGS